MNKKMIAIAAATLVAAGVAVTPQAASADDLSGAYQQVDARLAQLAETQSAADAERIMNGGGDVQALVDPDTGQVLAAFRSTSRSLVSVGPGCTTSSACMNSSTGVPYGYTGSGTKTGTWKNSVRVSAGDRRTSYAASNGAAYNYSAGVTISWSRAVTVVKISR
jgi:Ni/Co efflux regulator RcnB